MFEKFSYHKVFGATSRCPKYWGVILKCKKQKNQKGPRTSLMEPGGAVWGKKPTTKNLVRLSLERAVE